MSETYPGSISTAALLNFIRHHIYVTPAVHPLELRSESHPHSRCEAAANIISLLNLKDVAAKLRGGEDLIKGVNAQLEGIISAISSYPNPDDPGTSPHNNPPGIGPVGWHWHGPIPPGPLKVIQELNQYSKTVTNEKFVADISAVISKIAEKATSAAKV